MSRTEQHCACNHPELVRLPVHGLTLEVDTSGLVPAPGPSTACRELVDQDMHIYIDGNLSESGDGLSPETAVKSYADAVLALSRYDGRNTHHAHFHFADLEDQDATYPDITLYAQSYAGFLSLTLAGASYRTTNLGEINVLTGGYAFLTDLCSSYVMCHGWLDIYGKVALKTRASKKAAFCSYWGGQIRFLAASEVFLYPGKYSAVIFCVCGTALTAGPMNFHALGAIDVETAFVRARGNAAVWFNQGVGFLECAAVSGRKYMLSEQSFLYSNGASLPGSVAGEAKNGSIYV